METEDLAIEALHKLDVGERVALCDALPRPWTPGFTRELLREACRAMDTENHVEAWSWASILLAAAIAVPRGAFERGDCGAGKNLDDALRPR